MYSFSRKTIFLLFAILLYCYACTDQKVSDSLPRSSPEKQGVSSKDILHFIEKVNQSGLEWHSVMILRHGKVITEGWWYPYQSNFKHTMYSASKTFTSTAIGFAVSEGLLTVDDQVISFFPELLPDSISDHLAALRVKDLLSMQVVQQPEPTFTLVKELEWVKSFFNIPIVQKPGTSFQYNSIATYMLSAIIQKVTGQTMLDYLKLKLFQPLGIQDVDWEVDPVGINTGGWGLRITTEAMAKTGQLYLQKGLWKGRQLLPEQWISEATAFHVDLRPDLSEENKNKATWVVGYGYQIWRYRSNIYWALGAYSQFIAVIPDLDVVVAITAEASEQEKVFTLVWDHLIPFMRSKGSLPADKEQEKALQKALTSLVLPVEKGVISPMEKQLTTTATIEFAENESSTKPFIERIVDNHPLGYNSQIRKIAIGFKNEVCALHLTINSNVYSFELGKEKWHTVETHKPGPYLLPSDASRYTALSTFKVSGSYCWKDAQTLSITLRYIDSLHTEKLTLRFDGDQVVVTVTNSTSTDKKMDLKGKIKK